MSEDNPSKYSLDQPRTNRRNVLKALAASGVTLGTTAFVGTAAADSNAVVRETEDLTGVEIYNDCTGELMEISKGTAGTMSKYLTVGTDECRNHALIHEDVKAFAEGQTTGATYRLIGANIFTINVDACGEEETGTGTQSTQLTWIGLGDAPDFVSTVVYKATITPNGDFVVEREFQQIKCDD